LTTTRLRLVHWNTVEAAPRAAWLQAAGYVVDAAMFLPEALRELGANPPAAVVIDLTRLPSQGRDVALQLRQYKPTRYLPLIFAGGDPVKVDRIKMLLPDAIYSDWVEMDSALKQALAQPPVIVVVPASVFAGYSGTPLVKKLGIKAKSSVGLINAPADFLTTLGELPDGVLWRDPFSATCGLILWFTRSQGELTGKMAQVKVCVGKDGLWIMWPKKASGIASDLSEKVVRETGLAAGLVDYKISAIDATWSGLRFTVRKPR
jgi:hypothetical protein